MKAEVFYTGGGIWLAEKDLGNGTYAVIDSEYRECLSIYKYSDDGEQYMPEDMIYSQSAEGLTEELKEVYAELYNELIKRV